MATSTHRITVNAEAYTNVSNGNLNCSVVNGYNHVRLAVAGIEPVVDTVDYLLVTTGTASVQDLEAEDDIWIRADKGEADVGVIRGPAKIVLAAKP